GLRRRRLCHGADDLCLRRPHPLRRLQAELVVVSERPLPEAIGRTGGRNDSSARLAPAVIASRKRSNPEGRRVLRPWIASSLTLLAKAGRGIFSARRNVPLSPRGRGLVRAIAARRARRRAARRVLSGGRW